MNSLYRAAHDAPGRVLDRFGESSGTMRANPE